MQPNKKENKHKMGFFSFYFHWEKWKNNKDIRKNKKTRTSPTKNGRLVTNYKKGL